MCVSCVGAYEPQGHGPRLQLTGQGARVWDEGCGAWCLSRRAHHVPGARKRTRAFVVPQVFPCPMEPLGNVLVCTYVLTRFPTRFPPG